MSLFVQLSFFVVRTANVLYYKIYIHCSFLNPYFQCCQSGHHGRSGDALTPLAAEDLQRHAMLLQFSEIFCGCFTGEGDLEAEKRHELVLSI